LAETNDLLSDLHEPARHQSYSRPEASANVRRAHFGGLAHGKRSRSRLVIPMMRPSDAHHMQLDCWDDAILEDQALPFWDVSDFGGI
jgi:hypothetical protein